jgi:pimeloyl-ACP methyl ester carboxylesterase
MNLLPRRLFPPFQSVDSAFFRRSGRRFTAAALLLLVAACVHTQPFKDAKGHALPGSIAAMEMVPIGGISQSVWLRGISRSNPLLILLHGGPGVSESALFRHFNSGLEQHFLMVYWEQRGTGRSYHADIPPQSMTIRQFLHDLDELVDWARQRFGKDKVVLLGHSWGTVLGTIYACRHPEKGRRLRRRGADRRCARVAPAVMGIRHVGGKETRQRERNF